MLEGMETQKQTPQRQTRPDMVHPRSSGRPQERYVREALRRLEDHRFGVPVVTPSSPSTPKQSADW